MKPTDIKSSPLWSEINKVALNGNKGELICFDVGVDVNGLKAEVISVLSMTRVNNFYDNSTELIVLELVMSAAMRELIIKYNDKLTVEIKTYIHPRSDVYRPTSRLIDTIKKYDARIYQEKSDLLEQKNLAINEAGYTNTHKMAYVRLQLVPQGCIYSKSVTVGGVLKANTRNALVPNMFSEIFNRNKDKLVPFHDGNVWMETVNETPNVNEYQAVIPHGTPYLKALEKVNTETGGFWATGFNYYIQDGLLYVYPQFSLKPIKQTNDIAINFINVPSTSLPGLDSTLYVEQTNGGKSMTMLSTRDTLIIDNRNKMKINKGTSFKFTELSNLLHGFAKRVENKIKVDSSGNNNDVIVHERNGDNYTKMGESVLTASKNIELSKVAINNGFFARIPVENIHPILRIKPYTFANFIYVKGGAVAKARGQITSYAITYTPYTKQFPAKLFKADCVFDLFLGDA